MRQYAMAKARNSHYTTIHTTALLNVLATRWIPLLL